MKYFFQFSILTIMLSLPLVAGPIGISMRDSTILRGKTVYIPVRVDSNITSSNVFSYEMNFSYTSEPMIIDSVITAGTMTADWPAPTFHLSTGGISVADAGTTALSGTGILFFLKLKLPLSGTGTSGAINFSKAVLNEGSPATVTRNASINITNLPIVTVSPDNALLTVGETAQFGVSGGTAPFSWSTTNSSVATINSNGLLSATHAGTCRVIATDANSLVDTSLTIEIRACKLSIRDTSYLQGQTFSLPIYVSDLSLVDILSGTFSVSYNTNVLTFLGTTQTGTLLQPLGAPNVHTASGKVTIGFAETSRLNGVGTQVLVYLQFKVSDNYVYGTSLSFSNIIFNENILATNRDGFFTMTPTGTFTVYANSYTLVVGDSLQFFTSGTITNPLAWSVSNPSLATISSTGVLRVLHSGSATVTATDAVNAKGTSSAVSLYDTRLTVGTVQTQPGYIVTLPVQIGALPTSVSAVQLTLNYNQTYLTPLAITTNGTSLAGWLAATKSSSPNSFTIAAASSNAVTTSGTVLNLCFQVSPGAFPGNYGVSIGSSLLNEGNPLPLNINGSINVSSPNFVESLTSVWNFVSLPLTIADARKTVLFPHAVSNAFAWNGSTYVLAETLRNKFGYWIQLASAENDNWAGTPRAIDTIPLISGWNMIGSIAYPTRTATIVQSPANIVNSVYFGYTNGLGYYLEDTLKPGLAYWVHTSGTGSLTLQYSCDLAFSSSNIPEKVMLPELESMNEIGVEQPSTSSNGVHLFFGKKDDGETNSEQYLLPPLPPKEAVDIRFASNRFVEFLGNGQNEIGINLQGVVPGSKLQYHMKDNLQYRLIEREGTTIIAEHVLCGDGSVTIDVNGNRRYSIATNTTPTVFRLEQNYPNPFNPATKFEFQIASRGLVKLNVFDVLGREIATIVDEELPAGVYARTWDAENFPSGVYYYRLQIGTFTETKKMVLMK